MAYDNRDNIDFGKCDIPRLFRSIFIPTLLGMCFNAAFTLTDGIFIGHGVGPDGLACVNMIAPIMMILTGIGMMFGIGCSVVAAIHLSKQNTKAARINVTQAFGSCILLAIVLGVVMYTMPGQILPLLGVSDELMEATQQYYLWFIPTCLFLTVQIVGEFVIRLDGSPKFAACANILPALINIVLDYVFIFPCGWGLMGAALATDIGSGVGALMTGWYMIFKADSLKLYRLKRSWTSLRLTLRNVGYMLKLGFSAFVGELAISVMMLTGNLAFGRYLGDEGIAAYSVICYLFPLVYMIYSAVAQSAQPIISYNYGAGETQRVRQTFRHSVSISLGFGAIVTAIFCIMPHTIISIFLPGDSGCAALAAHGLPYYAIGFVFVAFNLSAIGYFQSTERASVATILMLLRGVLALVAAFLLLPRWLGIEGLWLAVPCAEVLTFIAEICVWERKSLHVAE